MAGHIPAFGSQLLFACRTKGILDMVGKAVASWGCWLFPYAIDKQIVLNPIHIVGLEGLMEHPAEAEGHIKHCNSEPQGFELLSILRTELPGRSSPVWLRAHEFHFQGSDQVRPSSFLWFCQKDT